MPRRPDREFTHLEGFAFLLAMIAVQISSELFAQWGTYFYSPSVNTGRTIYVGIGLVFIIFFAGRVFDVITDPLIGLWSDRTKPQPGRRFPRIRGRRRPFIFWGSICLTFTAIAF
jgi:Na+/melibiose symporter-like transporter